MSVYHDNLEVLADFYVGAATLEGEERKKEELELSLFLQKLNLKVTPRGRTLFFSLVDLEDDSYPWSTLYPVGEAAPPALILVLNQKTDYVVNEYVDPSRMDETTRKEWETAVALSEKLATGWLPDEWKKPDDDEDDTVILEDDEPAPKPEKPKPKPSKPGPAKKPTVPTPEPEPVQPYRPSPDVPLVQVSDAIVTTSLLSLGIGVGLWGLWAAFKKD